MFKWFAFLLVCAFVAAEVALLVRLGGLLGVGWTLVWIFGTALAGLLVARIGGVHTLIRMHHRLRAQELPTREMLDMGLLLAAAFLLVMPGFLSDTAGLLLLLPPVRWMARNTIAAFFGQLVTAAPAPPGSGPPGDDVIEIRGDD